jgi:hypothetical protein
MWRMKTYLRCGNPPGGFRSESERRRGVIKGLIYPSVGLGGGLGPRDRFFAVACWTKWLDGSEDSARESTRWALTCTDNSWRGNAGEQIEG